MKLTLFSGIAILLYKTKEEDTMETLECIKSRRSVRRFRKKNIPMDELLKILDAGRLAPSAGNIQGWIFVVVRDKKKKEEISEAAFGQMWMAEAPVIIVICSDLSRYRMYYGRRGEELYSIMDASAAAENILLAARDFGYGSCWVSAFDEEKIKRILKIPEEKDVRPLILVPIGLPISWPPSPPKKLLEAVVRWEEIDKEIP